MAFENPDLAPGLAGQLNNWFWETIIEELQ